MVALPLDDARIEELVLRFNAVMANAGTDFTDLGSNASDDKAAAMLQETKGNLNRDKIIQDDRRHERRTERRADCAVRDRSRERRTRGMETEQNARTATTQGICELLSA